MTAMTLTATGERIFYTVAWGADESDRVEFIDYGDGSYISTSAEHRANRCYVNLVRNGVTCGLWTGATLVAGSDTTDVPDAADNDPEPTAAEEHKTRTVLDAHQGERYKTKSNGSCGRFVRGDTSVAMCSCGWEYHAGSRVEARGAARGHRAENGST